MPDAEDTEAMPEEIPVSGMGATFAEIHRRLRGKSFGRLADLATGLMMLGLSGVGFLYADRATGFEPITVWPLALWAGLHVLGGLALSPLLRKRRTILVVGYGVLLGLLLSEEPLYLLRAAWHDPAREISAAAGDRRLMRAVSLNCRGNARAIEDAIALDADIVLVQESPGAAALTRALPDAWAHAGHTDCAVLVRGQIEAPEDAYWSAGKIVAVLAIPARTGRPVTAISTHVQQPVLRTDIWRPEVWRRGRYLHDVREKSLRGLLDQRDRYGQARPVLAGGDFNTRADDPLLLTLETAGLTDVFQAVGVGWPNTFSARFPIERIDFLWADERFEPLRAFVATTEHSDHRMVVADVRVTAEQVSYSPSSARPSRR